MKVIIKEKYKEHKLFLMSKKTEDYDYKNLKNTNPI